MTSAETNIDSKKLEPLLEERKSLLHDINDARLSQPSDIGSKERLHRYILRYEDLMDQIEVLTFERSPLSDPLKVFPAEIWQEILRLASYDSSLLDRSTIDSMLFFTLVSDLWRQKILSSSTLWTDFQLRKSGEDQEAKFATAFHLCADLPLDLEFSLSKDILDMICPYIVRQGHRIRTLLIFDTPSIHNPSELLAQLVGATGRLTGLENLNFIRPRHLISDDHTILKDATQIKSLHHIYMAPEVLQLDSMQYLRRLTTEISLDELIRHLSRLRHLTTINVFNFDRGIVQPETSVGAGGDKRTEDTTSSLGIISCKVSSLTIYYTQPSFSGFLRRTAQSLTYLRISIYGMQFLELITVSQDFVKLKRLEIHFHTQGNINNDHRRIPASSDIKIPKINVKNLTLNMWTPHYFYPSGADEEGLKIDHDNAKRVVKIAATWIPDVEHLNVQTAFDDAFLILYIQSLQYLRSLDISGMGRVFDASASNVRNAVMALPSVETVSISGRSSVLVNFSYPNSHHLSLRESQRSVGLESGPDTVYETLTTLVDSKTGMELDNWTRLTSLDIIDPNADWTGISLPGVVTITIGSAQSGEPAYRLTSSSLLAELASKRDAFPSLQNLGMRCIPEWDLLFIMLERRNFSANNPKSETSSTPITCLDLPGLPPPFILQPLISRLRRRLTKRPSNYDLSLQSLVETYFEPELRGCDFCHMSYLPCSADYSPERVNYKTPESQVYPSASEGVVAASGERVTWWAKAIRLGRARCRPCGRYDPYNLMEIHVDTDTGYIAETAEDPSERMDYYYPSLESFFGENN